MLRWRDAQLRVSQYSTYSTCSAYSRKHILRLRQRRTRNRFVRLLKPIFKGNRFHIAKKRAAVKALIGEFDQTYRELMRAAGVFANEFYGSAGKMQRSIIDRAAFENRPIELYRTTLYREFDETIAQYKSTGDVEIIRALVEEKIQTSLRRRERKP